MNVNQKNEVLKFANNKLEDIKKRTDLLNELENNYKELDFRLKIGTVLTN